MEAFIRGERVARCGGAAVMVGGAKPTGGHVPGWMPERRNAEP